MQSKTVVLVVCLTVAAIVGTASADWVTATVPAGSEPWAVAVNPVTNKIYVANRNEDNVTVIDGATNDTTLVAADAAGETCVTDKLILAR